MPTVNPRINVTLSPSTDALVSKLAGLQRVSKSQVLRELLEAAEPALQRAATLMEAAASAKVGVLDGLAKSLDKAQADAERTIERQLGAMDDLVRQAEAIGERRPARPDAGAAGRAGRRSQGPSKGAAVAQDPPPSNRGVRAPQRAQSDGKQVPRKGVGKGGRK